MIISKKTLFSANKKTIDQFRSLCSGLSERSAFFRKDFIVSVSVSGQDYTSKINENIIKLFFNRALAINENFMKNVKILAFFSLFLISSVGCVENKPIDIRLKELNSELDSLQLEYNKLQSRLTTYQVKYGELPVLDPEEKKFGIWKISYYVDDFGDYTKDGYAKTICDGTFSNSATTNDRLAVQFLVDKSNIRIQLHEYAGIHPIKGEGLIKFKAKGMDEVFEFETCNNKYGDNAVKDKYYKHLLDFLQKGGEIKFYARTAGDYGLSEYNFTLNDPSYIKEALQSFDK